MTLGAYLERWLDGAAKNAVKVRTYETYVARKSDYIDPYLSHVKLETITPGHLPLRAPCGGPQTDSERQEELRGFWVDFVEHLF